MAGQKLGDLRLQVLSDKDYAVDVSKHSSAHYERFVRPEVYLHRARGCAVVSETLYRAATAKRTSKERRKARRQIGHECGHWKDHIEGTSIFEHPTDFSEDTDEARGRKQKGSIHSHAFRCGFDLRAGSWALRWRVGRWKTEYAHGLALLHDQARIVHGPLPQRK